MRAPDEMLPLSEPWARLETLECDETRVPCEMPASDEKPEPNGKLEMPDARLEQSDAKLTQDGRQVRRTPRASNRASWKNQDDTLVPTRNDSDRAMVADL